MEKTQVVSKYKYLTRNKTSRRCKVRRSLVATRDPLGVQIFGEIYPKMALFIVFFCSLLPENAEMENCQIRRERAEVRCGFGHYPCRGSNFMGKFPPNVQISYYFENALKICVLGISERNYHFHRLQAFHHVIVVFIERTRLCVKVDL